MSVLTTESIFSSRSFALYFAGQALSYFGDALRTLAIPLLVFHLTGSAYSLGLTYALEFFPFAIAGLVGGSIADRVDRRRLMIMCDFVRFAVIVLFALAYVRGALSLSLLYTGIIALSITAAFFMGGQASSIPSLVGKDRGTQAFAALVAIEQGSNMIGPPIGGALFAAFGPVAALVINAITYLLSQLSLYLVPTLGPEQPAGAPTLRELRHDIAEGFRFLWGEPVMRLLTFNSLFLNLFGMMGYAVLIPYLKRDFGVSDQYVGLFIGLSGCGAVIGSLYAGRVAQRWPFGKALAIAYVVDAVIFLPVPYTHNFWVAGLCWAAANAGAQFEVAQIVGWRLRVAPQDKIGRVFGAVRLVALIGVVPGVLAGGWLADAYGARLPMTISGLAYLFFALFACTVPSLRNEAR